MNPLPEPTDIRELKELNKYLRNKVIQLHEEILRLSKLEKPKCVWIKIENRSDSCQTKFAPACTGHFHSYVYHGKFCYLCGGKIEVKP